jgi:hypothetical protein
VELLGKVRDRSVGTSEPLQNAASGGIRERGERSIETGPHILSHAVQYGRRTGYMQGEASFLFGGPDRDPWSRSWASIQLPVELVIRDSRRAGGGGDMKQARSLAVSGAPPV